MADFEQYDIQGRGAELREMQSASMMAEKTSSTHLDDFAFLEPLQYQVELGIPMLSEHRLDGDGKQQHFLEDSEYRHQADQQTWNEHNNKLGEQASLNSFWITNTGRPREPILEVQNSMSSLLPNAYGLGDHLQAGVQVLDSLLASAPSKREPALRSAPSISPAVQKARNSPVKRSPSKLSPSKESPAKKPLETVPPAKQQRSGLSVLQNTNSIPTPALQGPSLAPKPKRGRPRKQQVQMKSTHSQDSIASLGLPTLLAVKPKRGRGRPRKQPEQIQGTSSSILQDDVLGVVSSTQGLPTPKKPRAGRKKKDEAQALNADVVQDNTTLPPATPAKRVYRKKNQQTQTTTTADVAQNNVETPSCDQATLGPETRALPPSLPLDTGLQIEYQAPTDPSFSPHPRYQDYPNFVSSPPPLPTFPFLSQSQSQSQTQTQTQPQLQPQNQYHDPFVNTCPGISDSTPALAASRWDMGVRLVYTTGNGDIETQIINHLDPDAHIMDYEAPPQVEMNDYMAALRGAVHGSGYFGDRHKP